VLPQGTVTFLFTDVEGSTRLLQELGDAYPDVLAEHRRFLRDAFAPQRRRAARLLYEETLELARDANDERAVAIITGNLGYLALLERREEDAEPLLATALELERAAGRAAPARCS
jgi:class 3 adenylate cyclase